MSKMIVKIPVIDFEPFIRGDAAARQAVVQQIYQACHEIGFMYLKNPGIPQDLIDQLFTRAKQFFDLPYDVKHQLTWSDEFSNRGYVGVERERLDPAKPGDLKEAFNVGKEISPDQTNQHHRSSLVLNQWPPDQEFRTCVLTFYDACTEVVDKILQAFALTLQLPEDFFAIRHDQRNHTLRLLHYPPLQQLPKLGQVRAGEHSD